jgi:hypothetical protein
MGLALETLGVDLINVLGTDGRAANQPLSATTFKTADLAGLLGHSCRRRAGRGADLEQDLFRRPCALSGHAT